MNQMKFMFYFLSLSICAIYFFILFSFLQNKDKLRIATSALSLDFGLSEFYFFCVFLFVSYIVLEFVNKLTLLYSICFVLYAISHRQIPTRCINDQSFVDPIPFYIFHIFKICKRLIQK